MTFPPDRCRRAAAGLAGLTGWRRRGAAAFFGLLAALALPPIHWLPVLWISLPALVLLMDSAKGPRGAFADGWWWGFGHFTLGFYWIGHAMLVDPLRFGWMIPFAVFGLAAVIALFPALATLTARLLMPEGGPRVLMLAAAWVFFEWCRSWMLTGFPWNLIGSVWDAALPVAQFAALTGVYGLSLLTLLAAALPVLWLTPARRGHRLAPAAALALLAGVALWGAARIPAAASPVWPGLTLRLVQADVPQSDKWSPGQRWLNLEKHIDLSNAPGKERLAATIWPETAAQTFIADDANGRAMLTGAVPPHGLLLTGAPRGRFQNGELVQIWNSLQALDPQGHLRGSYDKAHLVPFGEYTPYRDILPIPKLTAGSLDFSAGPGPRTLTLPGLPPVGPIICYEAIFPGAVVDRAHRPDWLLNVTNDGWFGTSAGPYQHFAAARMRAIEEGLPLVRDANTGISAVVDPYGRILGHLALGASGSLDLPLPKPLAVLNPFAVYGNSVVLILLGVCAALALFWRSLLRFG